MLEMFRNAWCAETAHPAYKEKWSPDNPSAGQCAVTALIIQEMYGGDIYACKVGRSSHFVNIINDKIIDMTADQFGGADNIMYVAGSFKFKSRKSLLHNKDVRFRYELLKSRLVAETNSTLVA
jgi:hypothetical protein